MVAPWLTVLVMSGIAVVCAGWMAHRTERRLAELERAHRRLHFEATHDALTGLPNRQLFDLYLADALQRGSGGGLLFLDLDRFKVVNDRLGHLAGDDLLREVAQVLRESVRDPDVVARLAGDEFVVVVASEDEHDLHVVARRLAARVRLKRDTPAGPVTVTASIGMVRWSPGTPPETAAGLVRAADEDMYRVKRVTRQALPSSSDVGAIRPNPAYDSIGVRSPLTTAATSQAIGTSTP